MTGSIVANDAAARERPTQAPGFARPRGLRRQRLSSAPLFVAPRRPIMTPVGASPRRIADHGAPRRPHP